MFVNIAEIQKIMHNAGEVIIDIYNQKDLFVEEKADEYGYVSPLTQADQAAHTIIQHALQVYTPNIPVLSEESQDITYENRKQRKRFWCVDPLDGTKEFIKRNGEFTINIALIEDGYPVFGCIYVPVEKTYYRANSQQAWKQIAGSEPELLCAAEIPENKHIHVVASRSHQGEEDSVFIATLEEQGYVCNTISRGSALKFCLIAEGKAHVYPRFKPTMERDTAAGQCIIESAGGSMQKVGTKERFRYNKENLRNEGFIVGCDPTVMG